MSDLISVVIPTFNGARYLPDTIQSVQAQTHSDWELVVVDDGSEDDTPRLAEAIAKTDSRIRVVRQANAGGGQARQSGFGHSNTSSKYVLFLDHDDILHERALERLASAREATANAVGAHGRHVLIDGDGQPISSTERPLPESRVGVKDGNVVTFPDEEPTSLSILLFGCCIVSFGSCLIARAALEEVGGIRAEWWPVDDHDLWIRLSAVGVFAFVPETVLYYRSHASSVSADDPMMQRAARRLAAHHLNNPRFSPEQRALAKTCYRLSALAKFGYARQSLRAHDLRGFALQSCRAVAHYARYIRYTQRARQA